MKAVDSFCWPSLSWWQIAASSTREVGLITRADEGSTYVRNWVFSFPKTLGLCCHPLQHFCSIWCLLWHSLPYTACYFMSLTTDSSPVSWPWQCHSLVSFFGKEHVFLLHIIYLSSNLLGLLKWILFKRFLHKFCVHFLLLCVQPLLSSWFDFWTVWADSYTYVNILKMRYNL